MSRMSIVIAIIVLASTGACNQMPGPSPSPSPPPSPSPSPSPDPDAPFKAVVNEELIPQQETIPDIGGESLFIAASRDAMGVQSDFVEGLVLVQTESEAELLEFIERYNGTILRDNTIPEPPPELGITLTAEQRAANTFVVMIDLDGVDTSRVVEDATDAGIEGVLEFSSDAGLRTFAGILDAKASGYSVSADWISHADQVPFPAGAYQVLLNSQERPTPAAGAGTFQNGLSETHFGTGMNTSNSNVALAWQFVAAHGIQRRVRVAIIDSGFWLDAAGMGRVDPMLGNDSDFPTTRPIQADFSGDGDSVADGPSLMRCANTPCFWHGTGSTSVATGILDNRLGDAGVGGQVADPMLFRIDGTKDTRNSAIRTAIAWGADVVSMSFGMDCDVWCRIDDRGGNPFRDGSIIDDINAATATVFVASAGNGRGNPGVGYDVDGPDNYYHPCTFEHVICVGALNDPPNETTKQTYSNFGSGVTIFAPTNIPVMAQPAPGNANPAGPAIQPNPATTSFGGTSASAPFVAGVAAMMKALNPSLSADDVARILIETSQPGGDAFVTRIIDAYAAVHSAADGVENLPDRFEPNNGPAAPTDLGNNPPYNEPNLSINAQDHDFFEFESPGAAHMLINLQYPGGLGDLSLITLQSLGDTCGALSRTNDATSANGRILGYEVPGGLLKLGLRAEDVNAYHLGISFGAPATGTDVYEVNNDVPAARYIYSFASGIGGTFVINPSVTINATIHNDIPSDVDYYIVRGARLSNAEAVLLFGSPFVSIYANTAPVSMHVYLLNDDGTQGAMVGVVDAASCAAGAKVLLQSDVYYLVKVDGDVGSYTLFNGALVDPTQLPPILVGNIPPEIIRPGPVEIEKQLKYAEYFSFFGDPSFDGVVSLDPGVHLSLFDLAGDIIAEGTPKFQGERLSLADTLSGEGYVLRATPTNLTDGPPTLRIQWEAASPTRTSENLVQNPGAEIFSDESGIPHWNFVESSVAVRAYGESTDLPSESDPGPADRGLYFFAGGSDYLLSTIRQTIVVDPSWREAIDTGRVKYRFAAFMGGDLAKTDAASARLIVRRADDSVLASVNLPEVTPLERDNQTGLFPVETSDYLPEDAAVIIVDISFKGSDANFNYAYADNIELFLSEYAQ
ncbi:MAG: S8/S53 family peptidase [Phycisphaerae bacterium]